MAKKKAASAGSSTASSPTRGKNASAARSASNGDASTSRTVFGAEQIGMTAGAVWNYLNDNGEASLASLKKELGTPTDLTIAAIGWLAREEKLEFVVSGKTVKLSLK